MEQQSSIIANMAHGFNKLLDSVSALFVSRPTNAPLRIESIQALIDQRFVPQAPMSETAIDTKTRLTLSEHGYKHAKEITATSHPEFYANWTNLCHRAGYKKPMQLILCESQVPNAFAISGNEMGITTGLLTLLTYREVNAALGHELAHARNFEKQTIGTAAGAAILGLIGLILPWVAHTRRMPVSIPLIRDVLIASSVGSTVGAMAGRKIGGYSAELHADFEGAIISHDPEALQSALQKLYAQQGKQSTLRKAIGFFKDVHPHTDERNKWLGEVKRELDAKAPLVPPAHGPAPQVQGGQADVQRISTNSSKTAISGA